MKEVEPPADGHSARSTCAVSLCFRLGIYRSCLAGSVRAGGLVPSYSGASRAGFSYELQVLANEPALPPLPSNRARLPVSTLGLHVKTERKSTVERDMRVGMPEQLRNAETVCNAERETAFYRARADARTTGYSHDLERTAEMKPSDFRGDEE
jgi:hypothetical protein